MSNNPASPPINNNNNNIGESGGSSLSLDLTTSLDKSSSPNKAASNNNKPAGGKQTSDDNRRNTVKSGTRLRVAQAVSIRIKMRAEQLAQQRRDDSSSDDYSNHPAFKITHAIGSAIFVRDPNADKDFSPLAAINVANKMIENLKQDQDAPAVDDFDALIEYICKKFPLYMRNATKIRVSVPAQHIPVDDLQYGCTVHTENISDSTNHIRTSAVFPIDGFNKMVADGHVHLEYIKAICGFQFVFRDKNNNRHTAFIPHTNMMLTGIFGWTNNQISACINFAANALKISQRDAEAVFRIYLSGCETTPKMQPAILCLLSAEVKKQGLTIYTFANLLQALTAYFKRSSLDILTQVKHAVPAYKFHAESEEEYLNPQPGNFVILKDDDECEEFTLDEDNGFVPAQAHDASPAVNEDPKSNVDVVAGDAADNEKQPADSSSNAGGDAAKNNNSNVATVAAPAAAPSASEDNKNTDAAATAAVSYKAAMWKPIPQLLIPQSKVNTIKETGAFNFAAMPLVEQNTPFEQMKQIVDGVVEQEKKVIADKKVAEDDDNKEKEGEEKENKKKEKEKEILPAIAMEIHDHYSSPTAMFFNESSTFRCLARASTQAVVFHKYDDSQSKTRTFVIFVGVRFGETQGHAKGSTVVTKVIQPIARNRYANAVGDVKKIFKNFEFKKAQQVPEGIVAVTIQGQPAALNAIGKKYKLDINYGREQLGKNVMTKKTFVSTEIYKALLDECDGKYMVQDRFAMQHDDGSTEHHRATIRFKTDVNLAKMFETGLKLWKNHKITSTMRCGVFRILDTEKKLDYKKVTALRSEFADVIAKLDCDYPPVKTWDPVSAIMQNDIALQKMAISEENLKKQREDSASKLKKKLESDADKLDVCARKVHSTHILFEPDWKEIATKYNATVEFIKKFDFEHAILRWKDAETAAAFEKGFDFYINDKEDVAAIAGDIPKLKKRNEQTL